MSIQLASIMKSCLVNKCRNCKRERISITGCY